MWHTKSITLLRSEYFARKVENAITRRKCFQVKVKTLLPSEDVFRKGENAFRDRKRSSKRRKRVYRGKPRLVSENVAIQGEKAITE